MTREEIKAAFLEELTRIAPDIDAETIEGDDDLMDDLELDSMDILNLVTALHQKLGVSVPETDYARLETLNTALDYLSERLA